MQSLNDTQFLNINPLFLSSKRSIALSAAAGLLVMAIVL